MSVYYQYSIVLCIALCWEYLIIQCTSSPEHLAKEGSLETELPTNYTTIISVTASQLAEHPARTMLVNTGIAPTPDKLRPVSLPHSFIGAALALQDGLVTWVGAASDSLHHPQLSDRRSHMASAGY